MKISKVVLIALSYIIWIALFGLFGAIIASIWCFADAKTWKKILLTIVLAVLSVFVGTVGLLLLANFS